MNQGLSIVSCTVVFSLFLTGCSLPKIPSLSLLSQVSDAGADQNQEPLRRSAPDPAAERCNRDTSALAKARSFVVRIETRFALTGPVAELGAGVLVAMQGNTAYIATARHVISKLNAGRPDITVTIESIGSFKGEVSKRLQVRSPPYDDLAVVTVALPIAHVSAFTQRDWKLLREQADAFDTRNFIVIGNPAGRGLKVTEPGPAQAGPHEIRVNSVVMEPGYSGGGIFDQYHRLVGITTNDGGQFASGYPISSVLHMLRKAQLPVSLTVQGKPPPSVHLASVDAKPPQIGPPIHKAVFKALSDRGLNPGCSTGNAHRLLLTIRGWKTSFSNTVISLEGLIGFPNGGQSKLDPQRVNLFQVGSSPLQSPSTLPSRINDAVMQILNSADRVIGEQRKLAR